MSVLSWNLIIVIFSGVLVKQALAFPETGKWTLELKYPNTDNPNDGHPFQKSLYAGSQIFINIACASASKVDDIQINWSLTELLCWNDYLLQIQGTENVTYRVQKSVPHAKCKPSISLDEYHSTVKDTLKDGTKGDETSVRKRAAEEGVQPQEPTTSPLITSTIQQAPNHPKSVKWGPKGMVYEVTADGLYVLILSVRPVDPSQTVNLTVEVKMLGPHGYLSAVDWPLLPFYGAMCLVYVVFGLAWLAVSFCQWRDLLRVQFWIGAVILLGMLEKATFYAEYQSLNTTGESVRAAVLLAELVSCAKRTLARMLVIVVSLGFGIVKPRLGPSLHRVVLAGTLYFVLAAVESYLRVAQVKDDSAGRQLLLASVPLAVLDSAICWWIFSSLAQTTRTLRLRRNPVKLSLYRHFTNTLIFAVVSSLVFMLYSIRYHRLAPCLTDWKALWLDDAYWHLLFSLLLLVIMILWRPGNNNQRYAFSPLLDAPEDEDDDEDDEQFVNDAFGVKMRGMNRSASPKPKSTNTAEDDLKWVEENIPSSLPDTALPVLDSDEEIMTTKFEVSKMQ